MAATTRKFSRKQGRNNGITSTAVKRVIGKFRLTVSTGNTKHTDRPNTLCLNNSCEYNKTNDSCTLFV